MERSWKTTVFGICTIISAISSIGVSLLDGDPATNPDWSATVTAIVAGFGLIFAKDANKTGETKPL